MNLQRKTIYDRSFWLIGMALGILFFIGIYGVRVLDVTYEDWLFTGDDLQQHYIASLYYRATPWTFPIGMTEGLTYQYPISILYIDAIPLFAVFSKLLMPVLPETFQYFGWFGLVCYALNGAMGAVIAGRFTRKPVQVGLGSIFFILLSPVLQRLFGYMDYMGNSRHTALAAHFLILAAFAVWLYQDKFRKPGKSAAVWALLGGLCIWIQSYFVFMVGGIMLCLLLESVLRDKNWKYAGITFGAFCASVLANMFVLGGFAGGVSGNAKGFGQYSANVNSLINSYGFSKILPALKTNSFYQYEGIAYLGFGMLILVLLVLIYGIWRIAVHKREGTLKQWIGGKLWGSNKPRTISIAVCFVVFFLLALSTKMTIGSHVFLNIPLWKPIRDLMGVFRSGGRFMWCCMDMVMIAALWIVIKRFPKKWVPGILAVTAALQIWDFSGVMSDLHQTYSTPAERKVQCLDAAVLEALPDTYSRMLVVDPETCRTEYYVELGAFAWERNMTMNYFYLSRQYPRAAEESYAEYEQAAKTGSWQKDVLYVIDKDAVEPAVEGHLHLYHCGYLVFGTAEEVPGLEWAAIPKESLYREDGTPDWEWLQDKLEADNDYMSKKRIKKE